MLTFLIRNAHTSTLPAKNNVIRHRAILTAFHLRSPVKAHLNDHITENIGSLEKSTTTLPESPFSSADVPVKAADEILNEIESVHNQHACPSADENIVKSVSKNLPKTANNTNDATPNPPAPTSVVEGKSQVGKSPAVSGRQERSARVYASFAAPLLGLSNKMMRAYVNDVLGCSLAQFNKQTVDESLFRLGYPTQTEAIEAMNEFDYNLQKFGVPREEQEGWIRIFIAKTPKGLQKTWFRTVKHFPKFAGVLHEQVAKEVFKSCTGCELTPVDSRENDGWLVAKPVGLVNTKKGVHLLEIDCRNRLQAPPLTYRQWAQIQVSLRVFNMEYCQYFGCAWRSFASRGDLVKSKTPVKYCGSYVVKTYNRSGGVLDED